VVRPRWLLPSLWLHVACGGVLDEEPGDSVDLLADVEPPSCVDPVAPLEDGHHRPGDDCMQCHRQGGEATPFAIAGTLHTDSGGSAPAAGVTLHFKDAAGLDVAVVTAANGNFWSTDPLAFPLVAFVARCPDVVPMWTPLAERDVGCHQAGCHTSGFRIHP